MPSAHATARAALEVATITPQIGHPQANLAPARNRGSVSTSRSVSVLPSACAQMRS